MLTWVVCTGKQDGHYLETNPRLCDGAPPLAGPNRAASKWEFGGLLILWQSRLLVLNRDHRPNCDVLLLNRMGGEPPKSTKIADPLFWVVWESQPPGFSIHAEWSKQLSCLKVKRVRASTFSVYSVGIAHKPSLTK